MNIQLVFTEKSHRVTNCSARQTSEQIAQTATIIILSQIREMFGGFSYSIDLFSIISCESSCPWPEKPRYFFLKKLFWVVGI